MLLWFSCLWIDAVRLIWWCLFFGMMLTLLVIVGFIGWGVLVDVVGLWLFVTYGLFW